MKEQTTSFEQRVAEEHRFLSPLFARALSALEDDGLDPSIAALEELRSAVEEHLAQEDQIYYPALWALRPGFEVFRPAANRLSVASGEALG